MSYSVGSVCSGIEAASVAWLPLGFKFEWFSEIADFQSRLLKEKYPTVNNVGDMNNIPDLITNSIIESPDIICGGTPCQAFSLAGFKNGLNDNRGNLTLRFVDIVNANDLIRLKNGKSRSIVFWENVEGVLSDKTNAFGCLVSSLAGLDSVITRSRWPKAGVIYGPIRNVAWRVLDAKHFGIPQQRRRLYLIAGDTNFFPENILFEFQKTNIVPTYPKQSLLFDKDEHSFEVFREYTDCLYAAYGTKWNGNAAAYNGSLYVVQDERIRRLTPLECERLMGLPDNYTNITNAKKTNRYLSIGNSWAVPVIKWIGERLISHDKKNILKNYLHLFESELSTSDSALFIALGDEIKCLNSDLYLNSTSIPENEIVSSMRSIISSDASEDLFISPVGCAGILRRKTERGCKINPQLEKALLRTASTISPDEVERVSRIQPRGRFSTSLETTS